MWAAREPPSQATAPIAPAAPVVASVRAGSRKGSHTTVRAPCPGGRGGGEAVPFAVVVPVRAATGGPQRGAKHGTPHAITVLS